MSLFTSMLKKNFSNAVICSMGIITTAVILFSCQSAEQSGSNSGSSQTGKVKSSQSTTVAAKPQTDSLKSDSAGQKSIQNESEKLVVYYFYTTYRCASCNMIENFTKQAVESGFADLIKQGRVQFKPLNIDQPEYEHFVKDYKLYTKSVIVSDTKDRKEVRWKNLDKVWALLRDQNKFIDYVQTEIKEYL